MENLFGEKQVIENKDWKGDRNSVFKTLSASSHSKQDREENDYYATDPIAVEMLLDLERVAATVWEPACGEGHISKVLVVLRGELEKG